MSRHRPTLLTVVLAALVLVLGGNLAAYAATGGSFLLGKTNRADATSVLTNTGTGPALKLRSSGAPPLAVTSGRKVAKLNADRVDGLDATALQTHATYYPIRSTLPAAASRTFSVDLPNGVYQVDYSVVGTMSAAGATLACRLTLAGGPGTITTLFSTARTSGNTAYANASGVVEILAPAPQALVCNASTGTVVFDNLSASQLVFTRIASVSFVAPTVS